MTPRAELLSLHIGRVLEYAGADGKTWRSAIAKEAVQGPVFLGRLGPAGNEVSNLQHHGGPDKAVLAYPTEHYALWHTELGLEAGPGGFGENLALKGLTEEEVCIGDVFELGGARLQISQPRQPCHTLVQRWGIETLAEAFWATARTGWYLRVLLEGEVAAGQTAGLVERPHPGWTVVRVLRLLRDGQSSLEDRMEAAALVHLSPSWREKLAASARR